MHPKVFTRDPSRRSVEQIQLPSIIYSFTFTPRNPIQRGTDLFCTFCVVATVCVCVGLAGWKRNSTPCKNCNNFCQCYITFISLCKRTHSATCSSMFATVQQFCLFQPKAMWNLFVLHRFFLFTLRSSGSSAAAAAVHFSSHCLQFSRSFFMLWHYTRKWLSYLWLKLCLYAKSSCCNR